MKNNTEKWLKGGLAAFVTGVSSSLLSAFGIQGANLVGIQIPQVTLKQFGVMLVSGGFVGAAAYFKQAPVPPDGTDRFVNPNPPQPPQQPKP